MNKFEVDAKGFAELQKGRPKWSFVRELVSNAFDELITMCSVLISKKGRQLAEIVVIDDGEGFRDLSDAYTLFAPTPKRNDPKVRGRFNLGEKELASIAKEMKIESTKGGIHFIGGKRKRINTKREVGTKITVRVNWTHADVYETIEMLKRFIPPNGVTFKVNDKVIKNPTDPDSDYKKTAESEETLATVLFKNGAVRPTKRKTKVIVYKIGSLRFALDQTTLSNGWLYEMGIPIQKIDCPYIVDVQQKVPMSPNRESVSDAYLQDIYAIVLNMVADDLWEDEISETWVRTATEDDIVTDDVIKTVHDTRYRKAVLWSSDESANERARMDGMEIIHGRTLSGKERGRFHGAGLVNASMKYGRSPMMAKEIKKDKWTEGMNDLAKLTRYLGRNVIRKDVRVRFINEENIVSIASYGNLELTFNLAPIRFGYKNTKPPYSAFVIGVILHELAHNKGESHDLAYIREYDRVCGEAVMLAIQDKDRFEKLTKGVNDD